MSGVAVAVVVIVGVSALAVAALTGWGIGYNLGVRDTESNSLRRPHDTP